MDAATAGLVGSLGGAIVGGLIGFVGAKLTIRSQSRAAHRGAVRAVVYELNTNLTSLDTMNDDKTLERLFVDDRVYVASLLLLVSELPGDLATDVAKAYFLGAALRATREFGWVKPALEATDRAHTRLLTYAKDKLGLVFQDDSTAPGR